MKIYVGYSVELLVKISEGTHGTVCEDIWRILSGTVSEDM